MIRRAWNQLELRLGGIYALERIAQESEKDYWPIMEVLTTYVREHAPIKKTIKTKKTEIISAPRSQRSHLPTNPSLLDFAYPPGPISRMITSLPCVRSPEGKAWTQPRIFKHSTLRERIVEHAFIGDPLRLLWQRGIVDSRGLAIGVRRAWLPLGHGTRSLRPAHPIQDGSNRQRPSRADF